MTRTQVYEGTLDEIVARYGKQLNGHRLKVVVEEEVTAEANIVAPATEEAEAKPFWQTATAEEWSKALYEWAESHDHNTPGLSDEAVERDSLYEGRGE